MDNVRTSVIGLTPFITHSIFVWALRQVSWRFIVSIALLASQRALSADKTSAVSDDGAPLSTRRLSVKGFEVEATSVGIKMEVLSALIAKEDESAANEIVKSRATG